MKIYEIVIKDDGNIMSSEQSHYVMAENFDEAVTQAHKRLAQNGEIYVATTERFFKVTC